MAHDVLISYSKLDKLQADAICNRLESKGVRCWIAPRDVPVGTEYADSIVQALEASAVLLLVYSSNADRSKQVKREVERAVSAGITIMPVRIEDAKMSKSFEYYVGSIHWLDAITPPLEDHIDKLADDLQILLKRDRRAAVKKAAQGTEETPPSTTVASVPKEPETAGETRAQDFKATISAPRAGSKDQQPTQSPTRRPAMVAVIAVVLALLIALAGDFYNADKGDYSPAEVTGPDSGSSLIADGPMTADLDAIQEDYDDSDYQSLVEICENQPAWQWSCDVPAIPDIEPFLDGVCACRGRILLHIETGLFRCEDLSPECGDVSFEKTLGYAPEMDWYKDVTPR